MMGRTQVRRMLAALMFVGSVSSVFTQTETADNAVTTSVPFPNIYCFSGSPLLLQVNVPNPGQIVKSISLESAVSSFSYQAYR
jgi:hypothetical protein